MTEREFATSVVRDLQQAGFTALFAGGCVRDELLGREPVDHDVATSATPDQVQKIFRRCHAFGASFGVVEVLGPRDTEGKWLKVQVATFRSDGNYSDGRRPDTVTFSSPEVDASRRDFTINGMFLNPLTGEVIDYVGGQADLQAKILRAIGDPLARFTEDKLRALRAARLAARFDLTIHPDTFTAARQTAPEIHVVSPERIAEELRKMLAHPRRARAVRLLEELELIRHVLAEVPQSDSARQEMLARLPEVCRFEIVLALLLRDGPRDAGSALCLRLKLSNAEAERISWLLGHARFLDQAERLPNHELYPVLAHPGIADLLALHHARHGETLPPGVIVAENLLRELPRDVLAPAPLLTGNDLKELGLKPGPQFKVILEKLREAQLDGEIRTAREARERVQQLTRELF